jgi:copper chaperone CopZ
METINFRIQGMSCGHCVASVKQAIQSVQGVDSVTVDLASGSAKVQGEAAIVEEINKAVQEQGYSASQTEE